MHRSKYRQAFATIYFKRTHEILARMPLNSFSWSICWAFGAKCSWQNFVMVCLSWGKRWGETHTLHLINILSSASLGHCQASPGSQTQKHETVRKSTFQVSGWKTIRNVLQRLKEKILMSLSSSQHFTLPTVLQMRECYWTTACCRGWFWSGNLESWWAELRMNYPHPVAAYSFI